MKKCDYSILRRSKTETETETETEMETVDLTVNVPSPCCYSIPVGGAPM